MSQENNNKFSNRFNRKKIQITQRLIVITLLIILIIIVLISSFGRSQTKLFSDKGNAIKTDNQPSVGNLPKNGQNGFSIPGFTPPANWLGNFNPSDWGNIIPSGGFTGGGGSLPTGTGVGTNQIPTISIPTIGGGTPTIGGTHNNFNPGKPQISNPPTPPSSFNFGNRPEKARNLPALKLNFVNIKIGSISFGSFSFNFKLSDLIFLIIMGLFLYINKDFLPNLIKRLEEEGNTEQTVNKEILIKSEVKTEEQKRKLERLKRLIVFKDHVDELIKKSKIRLISDGAVLTIITGYHELDDAFAKFSKLTRTKDITPLEHARKNFITGEIDNDELEGIVNLFYLARFGHRKLNKIDGEEFIEHLMKLVLQKSTIQENNMIMENS